MRILSLLDGITMVSSRARAPLRRRVKRSAMGSVIDISCAPVSGRSLVGGRAGTTSVELPAGLDHARNLAPEGAKPEADPAHLELAQEGPRPAAEATAVVVADLEL